MKISPAYDNTEKCKSRELIAKTINAYIEKDVRMIEFLGSGVGALYYKENIKNLNSIVAVEKDEKLYNTFIENNSNKDNFFGKRNIFAYNETLEELIDKTGYVYNVVNLDFCTFFYDNDSPRSPLRTIEKVFSSNILSDKSLVVFTFMTQGRNILLHKNKMEILQTPETISSVLENMIEASGKYKVAEHIYDYEYISCGKGCKTYMTNFFYSIERTK